MKLSELNPNMILLVFLGIVATGTAHKCYVCGLEEDLPCDNFDPANMAYTKECKSAKACGLQTQDKVIARTCETIKLQDCQVANDIQYCYCSQSLCNNKVEYFSDDEDLSDDGSGSTVIKPNEIIDNKLETTNESSHLKATLTAYLLVFVLM